MTDPKFNWADGAAMFESLQTDPEGENLRDFLKQYANLTKALTPTVNDSILIEDGGQRWEVKHLPSKQELAVRAYNQRREIRTWFGYFVGFIGAYLIALVWMPYHGPVSPGQHGRDVRAFAAGVVCLAITAWCFWSKPKLKEKS